MEVTPQGSKINPNVDAAIAELVSEGSKVEFGILNIVANRNIGIYPSALVPNSYINGDQLWVRKNAMQVGASRENTVKNAFYSPNAHQIQKIAIDQEWWVRYEIDINALNSLAKTFTGQDLKDQLTAILFEGMKLSIAAKFDSEMIDLYNKGDDEDTNQSSKEVAGVIHFSIEDILNSTDPINTIIDSLNKVNKALSDKESQITGFRLGANDSNFAAITQPYITNLLDNYILRFGTNDGKTIDEVRKASDLRQLFGIPWRKHPFFNQVVNRAAVDLNNMTEDTVFDATSSYDFTGLAGLITHSESGLLPLKFQHMSVLPDPHTGNYIVLARLGWGKGLVRPGLFIKIKDSKSDQDGYLFETLKLSKFLNDPTNASVTASGTALNAALETQIKAFTSTQGVADFANATITSTTPASAATVTAPTLATAIISIPVKSGKKADAKTISVKFFYKNA